MKKSLFYMFILSLTGSLLLESCSKNDDPEPIQVSVNNSYTVDKSRVLEIEPTVTGSTSPEFRWSIGNTLISNAGKLEFISNKAGDYKVTLTVSDAKQSTVKEFTISVKERQYSNRTTKILEYDPAFGFFVNTYSIGATTREGVIENINKAISQKKEKLIIDLGLFGGSAVFGFDHTIANIQGKDDFAIKPGGNRGLGIVYVAYDRNKNGKPDPDEWYEIPGSLEGTPAIDPDYQVNLSNKREDDLNEALSYNAWSDNRGNSGRYKYDLPATASYQVYPSWISADYVLKGKRVKVESPTFDTSNDKYITYLLPSVNEQVSNFDIANAVDKQGRKVSLPGIDFIKITTAIFSESDDTYGYYSLTIDQIMDLHL